MISIKSNTQLFIESELNKLCGSTITKEILGEFSCKSTWKVEDIINALLRSCLENTSIEDICSNEIGPSADTVHRRISGLEIDDIEKLINEWLAEVASRYKFHKNTKITVAFDLHEIPYYGERDKDWVTGMKRKKGTSYSLKFLQASIATGTIRLPLAVHLIDKNRIKEIPNYVDRILSDLNVWIEIKEVLLDRGFCNNEIINILERKNLEFIIAAVRHFDIKRAYETILQTVREMAFGSGIDIEDPIKLGKWARKNNLDEFYVDYVSTGRNLTPVRLVAVFVKQKTHNKDPLKRYTYNLFLYLTNKKCSARHIVKSYGKRWIIETDFRCTGDFKAYTNSRKFQARILLFGMATVLNALRVVTSTLIRREKEDKVVLITNETTFAIRQNETYMITGRRFKIWLRTKIRPMNGLKGGDA